MLPKINFDSSPQFVEAFSVCLLNCPCTDDDLEAALVTILKSSLFTSNDYVNFCAQCILSICARSESFKESHILELLEVILRIGENGDPIPIFKSSFNKPIEEIIGENIVGLLSLKGKSSRFIEQVLMNSPDKFIKENNDLVCSTIVSGLLGFNSRTVMYRLVSQLCNKGCIVHCSDELLQSVLDDMIWTSGNESVPTREGATVAIGSLIRSGALDQSQTTGKINEIFAMTLSSMDDSTSDLVRSSGIVSIKEVLMRCECRENHILRLFESLKERLTDSLMNVRVGAADLLCMLLPRIDNNEVIGKLHDVLIFIDDESVEMRESISRLTLMLSELPKWREAVIESLKKIEKECYHKESEKLTKELLIKISSK